jgi:hypothetical protein
MFVVVFSEQQQHLVRAIDNGWFGSIIFRGTSLSHLSFVARLRSRSFLVVGVWDGLFGIFICVASCRWRGEDIVGGRSS